MKDTARRERIGAAAAAERVAALQLRDELVDEGIEELVAIPVRWLDDLDQILPHQCPATVGATK